MSDAESEHSLASLPKCRAGMYGQEKPGLSAFLALRSAGSCNENSFPVLTGLVGETALAPFKWHKEPLSKAFYTMGDKVVLGKIGQV